MTHIYCRFEDGLRGHLLKAVFKRITTALILIATVGSYAAASDPKLVYLNMPDVRPTHVSRRTFRNFPILSSY